MPKRDEELEYGYEEEAEGYDEDAYEDEEDEEDEEYEDEEYEDEEEDGSGSGAMRPVLYAIAGLVVLGSGAYAYLNGMLPFSPKPPEAIQAAASSSPYANPNGFGKVHPAPSVPSIAKAVPGKQPVKVAAQADNLPASPLKPASAESHATKKVSEPSPAKAVHVKPPVEKAIHVAAKPASVPHTVRPHPKHLSAPVKVAVKHGLAHAMVHAIAGTGHYAVQCGAFASAGNASNLAHVLSSRGLPSWVWNGSGQSSGAFAVRSTVVDSAAKASILKSKFAGAGHPGAVLPIGHGHYVVQLGLFSQRDRASQFAKELNTKNMFVSVSGGTARMHTASKVLVGKFATWGQAQTEATKVRKLGVPAIVVHL